MSGTILTGCNGSDSQSADNAPPAFDSNGGARSNDNIARENNNNRAQLKNGDGSTAIDNTGTSSPNIIIPAPITSIGGNSTVQVGVTANPDARLSLTIADADDTFDGIGGIVDSAPLLHAYPEPQRTQILDYLFRPNYGQAAQVLKLEIGGDVNSTVNSEAAYQHTATDTPSVLNGYETWIAQEALKRNPNIKIWGLQWGAPGWIGAICSQPGVDYLVKWVQLMKSQAAVNVDYISAGQNEQHCGSKGPLNDEGTINALRKSLDLQGLTNIKIIGFDGQQRNTVQPLSDQTLKSLYAFGIHYPGGWQRPLTWVAVDNTADQYTQYGVKYWASEDTDFQSIASPPGALTRQYNFRYLQYKTTSIMNWTLIGAAYSNMEYMEHSETSSPPQMALFAEEPWSGHYTIYDPPFWSMAHTTQFTQVGWKYVKSASQHLNSGGNSNGSIVTYRSGAGTTQDWTVVIETIDAKAPQTIKLTLGVDLRNTTYRVFSSNSDTKNYFENVGQFRPVDKTITLTVQPRSIVTISSLINNGGKGTDVTNAPPSAAFPISYNENFDSYAVNDYKVGYFAPLQGAYRVDNCTGGRTGKCLVQAAAPNPIPWSNNVNRDPFALVGNRKWTDQTISADIKLPDSNVSTYGAIGGHGQNSRLKSAYGYGGYKGYELRIIGNGQWELAYYAAAETRTSVATGALGSAATNWHSAKLIFSQNQVSAVVDGAVVVPPRAVATGLTSGMGAILSSPSPIQYDNFAITSTSPAG
ncbi:hypothetical protein ACETRX_36040 [Labrys portucalensis]|uniref:galactosylceramidase n=1 Tax=Labrys neptuniae TaxID=376174 RepID=A0ABV6ZS50_9HYPH